ncbi:hypothetical protein [Pararobbsia alpina]|uniref:Error-prone DNA polymerase n=1 Tax=Pararobbsia alpina TaxID=621374 RepID=A0A6S7DE33_9BURK|nr:hypothetical protein [Pararobbsia alpina]CAB3802922.1 Error-prone DNA polymerase [Pararobbsia alpina]
MMVLGIATNDDETPLLRAPTEAQEIVGDYRALGLALNRHLLRCCALSWQKKRIMSATDLAALRNGQVAGAAGIVAVRQQPGTAKGIVSVTLEDESCEGNVIL